MAAPLSRLVPVGDPTAAACEGDFCSVPEARELGAAPEDQGQGHSPVEKASAGDVDPTGRPVVE